MIVLVWNVWVMMSLVWSSLHTDDVMRARSTLLDCVWSNQSSAVSFLLRLCLEAWESLCAVIEMCSDDWCTAHRCVAIAPVHYNHPCRTRIATTETARVCGISCNQTEKVTLRQIINKTKLVERAVTHCYAYCTVTVTRTRRAFVKSNHCIRVLLLLLLLLLLTKYWLKWHLIKLFQGHFT